MCRSMDREESKAGSASLLIAAFMITTLLGSVSAYFTASSIVRANCLPSSCSHRVAGPIVPDSQVCPLTLGDPPLDRPLGWSATVATLLYVRHPFLEVFPHF